MYKPHVCHQVKEWIHCRKLLSNHGRLFSPFCHKIHNQNNIIKPEKHVEIPKEDLFTFFLKKTEGYADRVAMVDCISGDQMTFRELAKRSKQVASFFQEKGYQRTDHVTIHVPNCIDYPTVMLGTQASGMVFTTANPDATENELNTQLKYSESKVLFTNKSLLDSARKAVENTDVNYLVLMDDASCSDSGVLCLSDILENRENNNRRNNVYIDPANDIAALLYSSSATGVPKGVSISHRSMVANVLQVLDDITYKFQTDILCVLPMFHVYALQYVMFTHLCGGYTIHTLPSFTPETFLSAIEQYTIQKLPIVPPLALFLLNHPMVRGYDLSSLQNIMIGAAPVYENVINGFAKKFPNVILQQGFGLTEALITHIQAEDPSSHRPGAAGKVMCNTEWKISCVNTGKALTAFEKGEVCLKGPTVMKGYHKDEEKTKACLSQDGWLRTGDWGYHDGEGRLFVVDRLNELIKYENVFIEPVELEDVLTSHEEIEDSCVVGVPNELCGEVPRAYVAKQENSTLTEADIQSFVDGIVSPHKKLRGGVKFVNSLPRSSSGKLLRHVLRHQYMSA